MDETERARKKERYAEANRDERGTTELGKAGHGERRARGLLRSATPRNSESTGSSSDKPGERAAPERNEE